jgi:hypothetical protein
MVTREKKLRVDTYHPYKSISHFKRELCHWLFRKVSAFIHKKSMKSFSNISLFWWDALHSVIHCNDRGIIITQNPWRIPRYANNQWHNSLLKWLIDLYGWYVSTLWCYIVYLGWDWSCFHIQKRSIRYDITLVRVSDIPLSMSACWAVSKQYNHVHQNLTLNSVHSK